MNKTIKKHLSKDAPLKTIIASIELSALEEGNSVYESLVRAIVFQQLSGKAASTIYGRFLALFGKKHPSTKKLAATDIETLRSAGLSNQKAGYVKNVAQFFETEKLKKKDWDTMNDEEIINYLTQIKGVGKWTVQMLLMFTLHRPDVLPVDDLVVQQAMVELYDIQETGKARRAKMIEIAEPWRPYRSYASRCLWKWNDTVI